MERMGRGQRTSETQAVGAAELRRTLNSRSGAGTAWWAGGAVNPAAAADDGLFTRPDRSWEDRVTPLTFRLADEDLQCAGAAVGTLNYYEPGDPDVIDLLGRLRPGGAVRPGGELELKLDTLGLRLLMGALADQHEHFDDGEARSLHQRLQAATR